MRIWCLVVFIGGLSACGPANEAPALEDKSAARLSAACSGCHMPGGRAIADLTGLSEVELSQSLLGYKTDEAGTTVMHRLARGYSEDDIAAISAYLAMTGAPS